MEKRKVAIIGATGGIGRALAFELAKENVTLLLIGRNKIALQELQVDLFKQNCSSVIRVVDLTSTSQITLLVEELDVDQLFLCAGVGYLGKQQVITPSVEEQIWQVNLYSQLQLINGLAKRELAMDIVVLCSTASLLPHPYLATYSATKSALFTYSLSFSEELMQENAPTTLYVMVLGPTNTHFFPAHIQTKLGGKNLQSSPQRTAGLILACVRKRQRYAIIGWENRLTLRFMSLLPMKWRLKVIGYYLKRGLI